MSLNNYTPFPPDSYRDFSAGWRRKVLSRQPGSFAKIAHRAIFKRSALPLGENERGFSFFKNVNISFLTLLSD
jgi:hypothetical protein